MSHFSVLVVGDDYEAALQPFHEFECTGTNDQYVVDVDKTAEVQANIDAGESLEEALGYYGLNERIVDCETKVDRDDEHKYGFAIVQEGKLVRAVDRTNPNKKWDWYSVGGRFSGKLVSMNGQRADQLRVSDFDLNSAVAKNADNAAKEYDAITNCIGGRSIQPWSHFVNLVKDQSITIDQARTDFHAQEAFQDLIKAEVIDRFYGSEVLDKVLVTDRDTYIKNESEENATTWAFLHNGEWSERGSMGWFGMSDATGESTQTYVKKFIETIKALPPETKLTVVDCHI